MTKTFHEIKAGTNYHDINPFLYWKHVELAKIQCFIFETLKPFFSKQAWDSYYHGILAATDLYDSGFILVEITKTKTKQSFL